MYTHFAVTRQNISPDNLLLIINNFQYHLGMFRDWEASTEMKAFCLF